MLLHAVVERAAREVAQAAVARIAEHATARNGEQFAHCCGDLVVDERRLDLRAALARERETDAIAAHGDVTLAQRRDAVRARCARVPVGADAEPAEVDEAQRDRGNARAIELVIVEIVRHRAAQIGQPFAEADEAFVLRFLLRGAEVGVVQVLLPARLVAAGGLELCARSRRDPDVLPRGRNRKLLEPLDRRGIADLPAAAVVIAERSFAPSPCRHAERSTVQRRPPMRDANSSSFSRCSRAQPQSAALRR